MVFRVLTDRQAEYVRLLCAGRTQAEIVDAMGIGPANLLGMRSSITARTGATPVEDVCRMIEHGEEPTVVFRNHKADTR
jgi:DNA-binding CsgD family transcriptional regulator